MKKIALLLIVLMVAAFFVFSVQAKNPETKFLLAHSDNGKSHEDKGAEEMTLYGGYRGPVFFPHRLHQNELDDCQTCHDMFAHEKGILVKMKEEGKLRRKEVMNKKCISCHKERRHKGKEHGPVTCSKCHSSSKE